MDITPNRAKVGAGTCGTVDGADGVAKEPEPLHAAANIASKSTQLRLNIGIAVPSIQSFPSLHDAPFHGRAQRHDYVVPKRDVLAPPYLRSAKVPAKHERSEKDGLKDRIGLESQVFLTVQRK